MTQKEKDRLETLRRQDEREIQLKNFVLTLLEQCKDERLTLAELDWVITRIKHYVLERITLHDGLTLR